MINAAPMYCYSNNEKQILANYHHYTNQWLQLVSSDEISVTGTCQWLHVCTVYVHIPVLNHYYYIL